MRVVNALPERRVLGLHSPEIKAVAKQLSHNGGEGDIRRKLVEADLVDCIVAMPSQLFYTTPIPVSIWFFNKAKRQKGKTLFIDARNLGTMVTRKLCELTDGAVCYIPTDGLGVYADTMGRMHSDSQFAGSSSVPAHVKMMGFLGIGNNPMVCATVAITVAIQLAMN